MNSIDNIPNNLYMLLLSLNRRFFNPKEALKSLDIAQSHAKVLFYIIHNGPTSISNIAKKLCISKPNMTPIIDKLVADGYVTRYYDPNDRRVILIKHTEDACKLFKSIEKATKEKMQLEIKDLDGEQLEILDQSINNILNIIAKIN